MTDKRQFIVDVKCDIELYKSMTVQASSEEEAKALANASMDALFFEGSYDELSEEYPNVVDIDDHGSSDAVDWIVSDVIPVEVKS